MILGKRLSDEQKEKIAESFNNGKTIDELSDEFNFTKLTISKYLKKILGEDNYKYLLNKEKSAKKSFTKIKKSKFVDEFISHEVGIANSSNKSQIHPNDQNENEQISSSETFVEITPLDYEIENSPRKDLSSLPISEVSFPDVLFMIVDKKIELEIKTLMDYPEWQFLPPDDLKRETIKVYEEMKDAKRYCMKDQKVIKIPNTDVFKIAAPFLLKRGISRIISSDQLISL